MAGRDIATVVPAGGQTTVSAAGSFVFIKSSSGELSIETAAGKVVDMVAGDSLKEEPGEKFDGFIAHNDSGTDITVVFVVGFGDFSKASVVGTITSTKATGGGADPDVNVAALNSAQVLALNTARREALITNLSATVTVRCNIGGAAGATLGAPIGPGQMLSLETSAGIYVYNPDAGVVSIAVLEISD